MASLLSSVTTVLTIVVVYAKHQELSCLKKSVCLLHLIVGDFPHSEVVRFHVHYVVVVILKPGTVESIGLCAVASPCW